nr:hypothetical protein [Tanacetum cinerariifolium]
APLLTSTTTSSVTTTTTLPPPPPQPQQSAADPTVLRHIGELEQHMANLLQYNLAMEERLGKHDSWLYNLENLNIPHQVRKAVDEIVTCNLEVARQKKRKRRDLPRTPFGSPPSQPPPPPSLAGTSGATKSSHIDSMLNDDSIPDEQIQLSDNEDTENDQLPKADTRKDWWKPLPEEERPATPEPAWTIPSFNMSDVKNNWATALSLTYATPAENSLLAKTRDIITFMNCQPLPLGGPPVHVTIQTQFFLNKDLDYLRYGNKGSSPTLSISKMKVARYPDFGIELLVPEQLWIDDMYMILCRVEKKSEHTSGFLVSSASKSTQDTDFKNLHLGDFEDLNLLLLQGYLDHLPGSDIRWDAKGYEFKHDYTIIESPRAVVFLVNKNARKIMRFNKIYKFSDGTLIRILEALDYRVKEFKIKQLNPGMNKQFWTQKDMTRSKEFIAAIERRLKMRRIYRNLECFVGRRVRDIDFRLLKRME